MFTKAIAQARQFRRPVILSSLFFDGTVESGMASFVVINEFGWILTAAHVFEAELAFPTHQAQMATYKAPGKNKNKPKKNPKWLLEYSYWWSADGMSAKDITAYFDLDLALARLEPWDPGWIKAYPALRDLADVVSPGTSVCRLGYPFHEFKVIHKPGGGFELPAGVLPAPEFPLDGIVTRYIEGGKTGDSKYDIKFLETSTPGLRGQSGGPLFDVADRVVGIQSRTNHLELGFAPKPKSGGKIEHQFLNVGCAVPIEVLHAFLNEHGVKFKI